MEQILLSYNTFAETYGAWGVVLVALLFVLFLAQVIYVILRYGRIHKFRNPKSAQERVVDGISVVVVLRNADYYYLEQVLPQMLAQEYDNFEVVIVDNSGNVEFSEDLIVMAEHNSRLTTTKLVKDVRFPISSKMALNVGIKAAHYENIVITTSDTLPVSNRWLSFMAKGFARGEVVLGYCGVEDGQGIARKLMRLDNVAFAVRWLSAAMRGKPYRGTIHNLGITKRIYFDNGGFTHLNMNLGEDDLFLQKVATPDNVSIVAVPNAVVRRRVRGELPEWYGERKFQSNAVRYYPSGVRYSNGAEQWLRALFFAAVIAVVILLPIEIKAFAVALLLLRYLVVLLLTRRICKRLLEGGLLRVLPLYDFCAPLFEAIIKIDRRLRKSQGLWR